MHYKSFQLKTWQDSIIKTKNNKIGGALWNNYNAADAHNAILIIPSQNYMK